ncbi:MAG: SH3 domain-containing protein, partial [Clostridiales Family XIII bacterium]|nr:SH3 domain-containing protein [Clostridiales Family XIII bacterium]
YTKAKGGKKITAKTKFSKNTTLYAHWKAKKRYGKVLVTSYLRKFPSHHVNLRPVMGVIKRGQTFRIRAVVNGKGSNDWYKLKYKGRTAYVYARFVKVVYR